MRSQGKPLFLLNCHRSSRKDFGGARCNSVIALLLLMLFGMTGCAGLKSVSLDGNPLEQRQLAVSAAPYLIQQGGGLYRDEALLPYLESLLQRLTSSGTATPVTFWRLRLLNDSTPRLLAIPGGELFLSRGLLAGLQSEEELLTLLAHAVAHADLGQLPAGEKMALWPDLLATTKAVQDPRQRAKELARAAKALLAGHYTLRQEEAIQSPLRRLLAALAKEPVLTPWSYRPEGELPAALWGAGLPQSHPLPPTHATEGGSPLKNPAFVAAFAQIRRDAPAYALFDEGMASERDGGLKRAIALYLQAAAAAAEEPPFYLALGRCYLQSGDLPSARRFFTQALKKGGEDAEARLGLGYLSLQQKEYEAARRHLEKSQSLLPTVRSDYLLGELWEEQGEKEQAADYYRRVLADAAASKTLQRSAKNRLKEWGVKP